MVARRLLLVVAVMLVVAGIASALAPQQQVTGGGAPAPQPAERADGGERLSPADEYDRELASLPGEPRVQTISAGGVGQNIHAGVGEIVRVAVRGKQPDAVQFGDDGPIEIVAPQTPARFELLVDEQIDLEIRLLSSGRVIGRIQTAN